MNRKVKKELKSWLDEAHKRNLDRDDILNLLKNKGTSQKQIDDILEFYDDEYAERERLKLSFFERRRVKKLLKMTKKAAKQNSSIVAELTEKIKTLDKKERKKLDELKRQMIVAILGNEEKGQMGLADIFDITDEDGSEINEKKLLEAKVEDVEELLLRLIDDLEKEI